MARITGTTNTSITLVLIEPQSSGALQLEKVAGTLAILQDGTYDFQLPIGIYDISLYDSKSLKRLQRCGVYISPTDVTLTLEGLLARL